MSTFELPVVQQLAPADSPSARRGAAWLRAARRAKLLAWASLAWMGLHPTTGGPTASAGNDDRRT
jgi:hypothetical protein